MNPELIGLPAFTAIGLEAEGNACTATQWIPPLWGKLMSRLGEFSHLEIRGCWGLMSASDTFLAPWVEQGRYLAAFEVPRGTEAFGEWRVWNIPASSWLRTPFLIREYDVAMKGVHEWLGQNPQWQITGATHESYPPSFKDPQTDQLFLYVPVCPKS